MPAIQSLGIDVGSTTVKIVGLDAAGEMVWHMLEQAEPRVEHQIERFLELAKGETLSLNGIPLVSTGYGRKLVKQANRQVTEITCHARGIFREFPHSGTLVDIGGQDSKVIGISSAGKVVDFMMNDKCAAGTGRFLENTSSRLGVPLERMGEEALSVSEEHPISSTCTVFAESEIISLLANGTSVAVILRGLHRSLVKRIVAMIRTVGIVSPLMFSGGVVKNPAITQLLEEETGEEVVMPQRPQLMGAYGAALIALELAGD
ncbi:MAG: 2-hydroxyglutaryl-CoA dehydratase [Chloroflexi bacterium]|nr:2-hydroxyglutaryl-CoA dehydratase [Chloroflexota bacterium]